MKFRISSQELHDSLTAVTRVISVKEKRLIQLENYYAKSIFASSEFMNELLFAKEHAVKSELIKNNEFERLQLKESFLSAKLKEVINYLCESESLKLDLKTLKILQKQLKRSLSLCRPVFDDRKLIRNMKNNFRTFDDEEERDFGLFKYNLITNQNLKSNAYKIYKRVA